MFGLQKNAELNLQVLQFFSVHPAYHFSWNLGMTLEI